MPPVFRLIGLCILLLCGLSASAQDTKFKWSGELSPSDARPGESAQVILTLTMEEGWHAYQVGQTGGPIGVDIQLADGGPLEKNGDLVAPKPRMKHDKGFNIEVGVYEKLAKFAIPVKLKKGIAGEQKATIQLTTQICSASGCDRPRAEDLTISLNPQAGDPRPERVEAMVTLPEQPPQGPSEGAKPAPPQGGTVVNQFDADLEQSKRQGLLSFMVFCFGFGLVALLTPCVYPMIPITVSYFAKRSEQSKASTVKSAAVYGSGIIATFTIIGLLVTILLGSNGTQILGANIWVNAALIVLFVALAMSLFGVFEIAIPASVLTKLNKTGQESGGLWGPLFLGLAFALTSFTCTVPIVGALLAGAASGDYLYPALGMISFSTAFALPFFLLALFPQFLKKMPKSGGWMTALKAFMGFLELAAALKFASNIDLVLHLGWLTRPVFLAIWAAIFILAGVHLFGWITLPHDSPGKIGWIRRTIAFASVAAGVWFLWGINDNSLGRLNGFLPPMKYPHLQEPGATAVKDDLEWIVNDYEKALQVAKEQGKPLFVDFTGYSCTNCRDMEANVFPRPAVVQSFKKMVLASIYVDEPGKDLYKIQDRLIKVSTLPSYVIMVPENEQIVGITSWTNKPEEFEKFLETKISEANALIQPEAKL